MAKSISRETAKLNLAVGTTVVLLAITLPRRSRGEDAADFKVMYYMEDDNRIDVLSPTISLQKDISSTLTLKIDGIYNSISGATPTGAPPDFSPAPAAAPAQTSSGSGSSSPASSPAPRPQPPAPAPAPSYDDEEDDDGESEEGDDHRVFPGMRSTAFKIPYWAKAGATPAPAPKPDPKPTPKPQPASKPQPAPKPKPNPTTTSSPSTPVPAAPAPAAAPAANNNGKVPKAQFEDERYAGNIELIKKIDRHTLSGLLSYSTESDYDSMGIAFKDSIDFNQKNTALLLGGAYTHDKITPANSIPADTKDSVDAIVGLTQLLDPRTILTVDFTLGRAQGLLTDPYKVVALNGELVGEKRPDTKDKQIAFLSLAHFFPVVNGSLEGSYRYYTDSFGIDAHTAQLAWFQKLGEHWTLRPLFRYYDQTAADFYGVRFNGSPEYYSSDYRVSALNSLGYGLKVIYAPNSRLQFDAEYLRYDQSGTDGITSEDAYPSANAFILGMRIWL